MRILNQRALFQLEIADRRQPSVKLIHKEYKQNKPVKVLANIITSQTKFITNTPNLLIVLLQTIRQR